MKQVNMHTTKGPSIYYTSRQKGGGGSWRRTYRDKIQHRRRGVRDIITSHYKLKKKLDQLTTTGNSVQHVMNIRLHCN